MSYESMPVDGAIDAASFLTETRPALVQFFRRRCKNLTQAEDLAQEVIVRTLNRKEWSTVDQARGYIFRTAANLWADQQRYNSSHAGSVVSWDDAMVHGIAEGFPPERVLLSEEELQRVTAAIFKLGERTRDIFVLSRLEHMKYTEIANAMRISVSAVEKHMIKALAHLARHIDDHDPI